MQYRVFGSEAVSEHSESLVRMFWYRDRYFFAKHLCFISLSFQGLLFWSF